MFNFGWKPQTIVPSFFGISSDPAAAITKAKTETNKPQAQCPYLIVSSVQIGPTDSPQTLKFGIREARPSDISPAAKRACSYYKGPQNQPTTENFAGDENAFSPLRDGAAQNDDRGAAMETEDSILTESGILRETRMLDHFEYSSIFGEGLGSILTQMNHRFGVSTPQHVYKEPEGPVQDYRDDVYKFCWGGVPNHGDGG
ncbi:hypothetical protein DFH27DRAFT_546820 [Peziza echinospora]|nr:hypothetical protein DFH27DRAFT_546820 [Peziza echinospora]